MTGLAVSDKSISVAVPDLVLGLEESDLLNVRLVLDRIEDLEPMIDGLAVGLFDGWEVRSWSFNFCIRSHGCSFCSREAGDSRDSHLACIYLSDE